MQRYDIVRYRDEVSMESAVDGDYVRLDDLPRWQPIDTAPLDRSSFLYVTEDGMIGVCFYWSNNPSGNPIFMDGDATFDIKELTHWMPLPEAPTDAR